MFSYRHAFHAGNHADVLKHLVLIATLRHLQLKEPSITHIDTHAGAGLYRLDGEFADKGGEAADGVVKLFAACRPASGAPAVATTPLIDDYLDMVAGFNPSGALRVYPGSPFVVQRLMRAESRDRLKLFELHPTDGKTLMANVGQLDAGRAVVVKREDGFEGLKPLLPPPADAKGSRRALVLVDPSYEIKSDYARVSACIQDALQRFATGTYIVWYPVIPRAEAHDLPRKLRGHAQRAGRPWLHATLAIGHPPLELDERPGLTASGVFVINPPHTLAAGLKAALPVLVDVLGRGRGQGQAVEASAS
ncbi:MAG: 23S rRNA (adenine(2030)-N(6))-methyltransferase RlmJ [Hydrogenophaga sp.]|uniref:23S rRNA (adenine(2030)-N(6))-methyltransferase RlmJ n=1 Tax=Hydrogenophaga sp. TaxID=1904254 RepID=UPI001692C8D1|nr:23S rRNA (adenine(2030)-N(6))-methyltransferase RlmJ [Hydrogenophaga sp.]NIM41555.1 23S rRNA (adenine(2030)-N(6))-methyltransferase RlmJ [Hydrogenophaga sp.]NIN26863.1 23S rRNA (adenine(2030)-N(6))-methyltransferase RlmJ [Hydrogenophaga sp.]NIN31564.1 23S rRNA (adenine(2030)-N(6))-methyltransferase RlmJ [Hydrogenophaga sp.]NIN55797.1 23S rRNA (adenine(2030)-N(6))-methyltransferase RlmJ [Hydrogenophaga sp.]NIO51965.1 23S rRNA (adenine(2030)-N(6))-methyltransferase RlmJ [Hydrogenophaga sp.]